MSCSATFQQKLSPVSKRKLLFLAGKENVEITDITMKSPDLNSSSTRTPMAGWTLLENSAKNLKSHWMRVPLAESKIVSEGYQTRAGKCQQTAHGRPVLLGNEFDTKVQSLVRQIRLKKVALLTLLLSSPLLVEWFFMKTEVYFKNMEDTSPFSWTGWSLFWIVWVTLKEKARKQWRKSWTIFLKLKPPFCKASQIQSKNIAFHLSS